MSIAQSLLPEFDHEMATTRKVLERVPDAKSDWKPHAKSFRMGTLAQHTAELVGWGTMTMHTTELDMAPKDGEPYKTPAFESTAALLATFDKHVAEARAALAGASDADDMVAWTLKSGGQAFSTIPRIGASGRRYRTTSSTRARSCRNLRLDGHPGAVDVRPLGRRAVVGGGRRWAAPRGSHGDDAERRPMSARRPS